MYNNKKRFKKFSLLFAVLLTATFLMPLVSANPAVASDSPANKAVQFLYNDYTQKGINNSDAGVGAYALYVINRAGADVSTWKYNGVSLQDAVISTISGDIANAADPSKASAKLLAQDLAVAKTLARDDLTVQLVQVLQNRQSITGFDNNLYSDVPAYDLLGRAGSVGEINTDYAKSCILGAQNTTAGDRNYGSFGATFGGTFYPDFMTTAEAVRALNYLDQGKSNSQVQNAIDDGCNWMKSQQQADGSFNLGGWDDPVIDTAEVIMTLKALGLDPAAWENSEGKTAVDYLMNNSLNADGSFGTSKNDMCATWTLCAYTLLDTQFYLEPSSVTLNVDNTKQFKAVWQNTEGINDVTQNAQWYITDNSIAGIDNSGQVTALRAGQTVVNAVYGGLTASTGLTVNASPGSGENGTEKTVGLAVVGMNSELLYGPSFVTVSNTNEWGLTALGALDSTGTSYQTSSWSYGYLVDSIEGQANSGTAGWMYVVNGSSPSAGPDKYEIMENDKIIFYYSKSMDQIPPEWDELEQQASGIVAVSVSLPASVSDTALNVAVRNAGTVGLVALQADSTQTLLALAKDQLTKILKTGKPLAVTVQGVQFVLSVDSLKVSEIKAAAAAQLQLTAQKLSNGDVQNLTEQGQLRLAGDVYELNVQVVNNDGTQQKIEQFPDCKVLLPVPVELQEAAAAGQVMAYRYDENSKTWQEVGGTYDANSGAISFKTEHFSKYALLENASLPEVKTFKDIAGYWAQKEIEYMAAKGNVTGVADNEFAPEVKITRAEFAAMLARMAGLTADPDGADLFSDVPAAAWYRGMVGAAVNAGLINGTSEKSFAPDEPVTREQMAVMLARFMAKEGLDMTISNDDTAKLLADFSDSSVVSPWAHTSVALMARAQLMTGRESDQFVPSGNATRAEAAVVLYRVLQKLQ